jgi:hypothetical protein
VSRTLKLLQYPFCDLPGRSSERPEETLAAASRPHPSLPSRRCRWGTLAVATTRDVGVKRRRHASMGAWQRTLVAELRVMGGGMVGLEVLLLALGSAATVAPRSGLSQIFGWIPATPTSMAGRPTPSLGVLSSRRQWMWASPLVARCGADDGVPACGMSTSSGQWRGCEGSHLFLRHQHAAGCRWGWRAPWFHSGGHASDALPTWAGV